MTSERKLKNLLFNRKKFLLVLISFFAVALVFGFRAVYAYYTNYVEAGLLANKIGDFDLGEGDIGMLIYKQNEDGKYVRTYNIPTSIAYEFDDTLTSCSKPCTYSEESGDYNCYYSYDSTNSRFAISSDSNVSCKFYFKQIADEDISISIMVEDPDGNVSYTNQGVTKHYLLKENVPAFGYQYATHNCSNNSEVTYNSETNEFTVSSSGKDSCMIYFDSIGKRDITANIYVQSQFNSDEYVKVDSIPTGNNYTLNNEESACYDLDGQKTNTVITYQNGYITINDINRQVCTVKLDLAN